MNDKALATKDDGERETRVVPPRSLAGRYPASVSRERVRSQVRLLRATRQFTQWAEDVLGGKVQASNGEKIAVGELLLKYTQPRMVLQEGQVTAAAMTLGTGDDTIKTVIARAILGSMETGP